jgi:hypothetical protein
MRQSLHRPRRRLRIMIAGFPVPLDKGGSDQAKIRAKCAARVRSYVCNSKCELEKRRCRLMRLRCAAQRPLQRVGARAGR